MATKMDISTADCTDLSKDVPLADKRESSYGKK
jgi:hypothetical protein